MDELKFRKSDLLEVIKANRAGHREEFETAMAGYEVEAIKKLQELTAEVKSGKRPVIMVHMAIPMDHTKDYDRIIRMLEMTTDDIVVLEENEFQNYVQDDWAWTGQFKTTNSAYLAAGTAARSK